MRLESALFSSREGLSAHGQAISVIGDNIANASTVGYKTSRIEFRDIVAGGPDSADVSPEGTVGNGVAVQKIRQIQEVGVIEATGRSLDLGIGGKGFFILGSSDQQYYSRAGNLSADADGLLSNADGVPVLGYAPGDTTTLAELNIRNVDLKGTVTTAASVFGNLNAADPLTITPTAPQSFKDVAGSANYTSNLSVFDSLGIRHDVMMAFYKTAPNTWTAQAYLDSEDTGGTAGVPQLLGQTTGMSFSTNGAILDANKAAASITATPAYSSGAAAGNFTIDLGGFTQYFGSNQVSSITQDGKGAGNIQDYEVRKNGEIYAVLDSGTTELVGTIPLATFSNVDGLDRAGNGLYVQGSDVGTRTVSSPGSDGFGEIQGGALERSTVDIANQFVDLVTYQRGYQANSQTLSAANSLLRDTLSLLR